MADPAPVAPPRPQLPSQPMPEQMPFRARLKEVAAVFTRLGFTAFGGPAAHVALMEDELVQRRRWLDRGHFLDIVAAINFIPGPNSTELAIHLGQLRAGFAGLLVAGACFITPAVLIILPIVWLYVQYGALPEVQPILRTIGSAIVAIIAVATYRFLRIAVKDGFTVAMLVMVMLFAFGAQWMTDVQPEVIALAFAAAAGAIWYGRLRLQGAGMMLSLPPWLAVMWVIPTDYVRMMVFFLKVGATLFGSGYVLVSYLQSGLVDDFGWMTQTQLLDAIAVGQFTPGPLLTTATFVGFLLGHDTFGGGLPGGLSGALVATVAIFLPSFVLVAIFGPLLQRLRSNRLARGALDSMNAAVVALMLVVAVRLALVAVFKDETYSIDWLNVAVLAAATVALLRWKLNSTWIVLSAGMIGAVVTMML